MSRLYPTIDIYIRLGTPGDYNWYGITDDVIWADGVRVQYGIFGKKAVDRVANSGYMAFSLNNSENNSAGLLGYYSPGHANCKENFDVGIICAISILYGGSTQYKFNGKITEIRPIAGQYRKRKTRIRVADWLANASDYNIDQIPVSENQRADELITTALSYMTNTPQYSDLDEGISTFPYVADGLQDESSTVLSVLNRATLSEFGYLYIRGNNSSTYKGGTFRFENRHHRATAGSVDYTLTEDDLSDLDVVRDDKLIANYVVAKSYPREEGASPEILYSLPNPVEIGAGESITIVGYYRDPDQVSARISGIDMQSPVVDTDYKFGSTEGGGANDLNANLTVTPAYGGNSVKYILANTGANNGHVNLLQARGTAIRMFDPQSAIASDSLSREAYGDKVINLNLLYQDSPLEAQDFASNTLSLYKDPKTIIKKASFFINTNSTTMAAGRDGEPGDRVRISETVSGINDEYFIDGITLDIFPYNVVKVGWSLRDASDATFWLLGTASASELGETTWLGF